MKKTTIKQMSESDLLALQKGRGRQGVNAKEEIVRRFIEESLEHDAQKNHQDKPWIDISYPYRVQELKKAMLANINEA